MQHSRLKESLLMAVLSLVVAVLLTVTFVSFHFSSYQTVAR
jgi:hypothetical protein